MTNRLTNILCVLLTTAVALSACNFATSQEPGIAVQTSSRETRDKLMIVTHSMPNSFDPVATNDLPSTQVRNMLYTTLIRRNPRTLELEPGLAASWNMSDAQTIHMELRQGVYFNNGSPFTAHDVAFSLSRAIESPVTRSLFHMIEYVEIHDNHSIIIHLNQPFVPIIDQLAMSSAAIVSKRALLEDDDSFLDNPVGTGPFMLEQFILGDRVVLVRNENYWGDPPAMRQIILRLVPEMTNRFLEVETRSADIALQILPTDVPRAEASDRIHLHRNPSASYNYIGFNLQEGPFADVRVRQAISYALDIDAIAANAFAGTGRVLTGPMTSFSNFTAELEPFPFDLERARELLAEAGYTDGFPINIYVQVGNQMRADVAELVQNQLRRLNIDVNIEVLELAVFLERIGSGAHDMFVFSWIALNPDPDYALYSLFHSSNFGNAGNRVFYYNPEVDRLLDVGRAELDEALRTQIYADIQQIIRNDVPHIFLIQPEELNISTPYVRGFYSNPTGSHWFWEVYFENRLPTNVKP